MYWTKRVHVMTQWNNKLTDICDYFLLMWYSVVIVCPLMFKLYMINVCARAWCLSTYTVYSVPLYNNQMYSKDTIEYTSYID